MLGKARKIVVTKDDSTSGRGFWNRTPMCRPVSSRSASEIENSDSDWDREKLNPSGSPSCLAAWPSSRVGAATEVELKEKKHRIEDAIQATKAAVEEGIVAGGGVALLRAQDAVDKMRGGSDDVKSGRRLVKTALEHPIRQIAVNSGYEGGVVVERVRSAEGANGFNAQTGEYEDLIDSGIIDPAKVTRSTLQNAASIAALLITTEALVAEEKEEEPMGGGHGHGGGGGGGMGGMEGMM